MLIERMQPLVEQCLDDPNAVWDAEPARLAAQTGILRLQLALIRDLGALYQVSKPPREKADPNLVPLEKVEAMLAAQQQVAQQRLDEAVSAAVSATREELVAKEQLSLEAARERVTSALSRLQP